MIYPSLPLCRWFAQNRDNTTRSLLFFDIIQAVGWLIAMSENWCNWGKWLMLEMWKNLFIYLIAGFLCWHAQVQIQNQGVWRGPIIHAWAWRIYRLVRSNGGLFKVCRTYCIWFCGRRVHHQTIFWYKHVDILEWFVGFCVPLSSNIHFTMTSLFSWVCGMQVYIIRDHLCVCASR